MKQRKNKNQRIPKKLQPILWSMNVKNLDLEEDKNYIIHQVLAYGSLDTIRWLFNSYSKDEVSRIFETEPMKIYDPRTFNFIKNYVLNLKNKRLSSSNYVTTIY